MQHSSQSSGADTNLSAVASAAPAAPAVALQRTPLTDIHAALGAKLVPFAGYLMPVQYPTGITAEHLAVRERCGLFDVSHMGELMLSGPEAIAFANHVTSNDVAALAVGQVQYSTILNARGTIEDDCLVYRLADRVMLVVNAGNRAKVVCHITPMAQRFDCALTDVSDATALLALQGPLAERVLQPLMATDLSTIRYYHFVRDRVAGVPAIVSRTGYTGEDGFELYVAAEAATELWGALMQPRAASLTVTPAGLGARDTLRLEMGMALYGHEIDDTTTPLEANLAWVVKLNKGEFVGRDALVAQKAAGLTRRLVGFQMTGRAFPRPGYPVFHAGAPSGVVCSGTVGPSVGVPIGTCFLPMGAATPGEPLAVEIRGEQCPATVVRVPFYAYGSHK
jgi:aminomethyltransferase